MKLHQAHVRQNSARLVAALALVLFGGVASTRAVSLPYEDGFDYAEAERLGGTTSGVNWTVGNSTGTGSPTISSAAALSYPGLMPLGGKGVSSVGAPGSNRDRGVLISPDASVLTNWSDLGTLYVSYLLQVNSGPSGNPRLLSAYRDSTGTGGGFTPSGGLFVGTDLTLGIAKQGNSDIASTSDPLSISNVYLVVLRYQYQPGDANDEFALWVNPPSSSFGAPESSVPTPTLLTTTGADDTGLNSFHFTLRTTGVYNGGGDYFLDEFRIGTTWASVTPPIPEPSALAVLGLGVVGLFFFRKRG